MKDRKDRNLVASQLRMASQWCGRLGSPLYAALLGESARDVGQGGPCWAVLQGQESAPLGSAMALRFMAAVHRLVLAGQAPALSRFYPSVGGDAALPGAWPAFCAVVDEHRSVLRELIELPDQAHEVGRCAALLGGFLQVADESRLPLRILEVGASAGLNLRWDHYFYSVAGASWGDPDSPVRLTDSFAEGAPRLDVAATVLERRGCDLNPLDPASDQDRLSLSSFVFADQTRRFDRLRGAFEVARRVPAAVDRAGAVPWLTAQLADPREGVATVVYHSLVMQYLSDAERSAMARVMESAAARATRAAPFAWLSMEHDSRQTDSRVEVVLTTWPSGARRQLGTASNHGRDLRWLQS